MRLRAAQCHAVAASALFVLATQLIAQEQSPTPDVMMWSVASGSDAALNHFRMGLRAVDVGQPGNAARNHFLEAVKADPSFALAHAYVARVANTPEEARIHLKHAVDLMDKASPAEKLIIQYDQAGAAGDPKTQLDVAQQLVVMTPTSPRASIMLATTQFALGQVSDGRATLEKAIAASPNFAPTYAALVPNYYNTDPRDYAKAVMYAKRLVEVQPNEAISHDLLGDAYRASNDLSKARTEYARITKADPNSAVGFLKLGHVDSFLGNFAAARADYDKGIALIEPTQKPAYGMYRAFVNVHAGNPAAAEREIEHQVAAIDKMEIPDKVASKIFVLQGEFPIAFYNRHVDLATRVVDQLRTLYNSQVNDQSTPAFRRTRAANTLYYESMLASLKGDFAGARAKAAEYMKVVEPSANPRKNEPAHFLLGMADFKEQKYADAAAHFAESNTNSAVVIYYRALALEAVGKTDEARPLFKLIAENNFNGADVALTKRDAARRLK
jgi:tetratricopeptide (TPR) repeat protein